MVSISFATIAFINSTFIIDERNLTLSSQLEENVKIDDFEDIYNSIEYKIVWFLTSIVFQTFSNAILIFIIKFEKYGGLMTFSFGVQNA